LIPNITDTQSTEVDHSEDSGPVNVRNVNTGIAVVVPFHSIQEVIESYEAQAPHAGDVPSAQQ